ncbi:MAG: leucine-rich repeat domain-containing protein [Prevotella sp.]|nr:leucine-rich repeat domain-containing protein [Prevotella sp.]
MKTDYFKQLALAVVLLSVSGIANAYDVIIDGRAYNLFQEGKTAEVTSGGDYTGSIIIPSTINTGGETYDVVAIGNSAFINCFSLTSITIQSSVMSIGYSAFEGCYKLTAITIPESVTSIGERAFSARRLGTCGLSAPFQGWNGRDVASEQCQAIIHRC